MDTPSHENKSIEIEDWGKEVLLLDAVYITKENNPLPPKKKKILGRISR